MAWNVFPSWSVGQVSLASDWNTYVAGNMNFLATPPILRAYRSTSLTTTASTGVLIPYNSALEDTQSGFSSGTSLYTVAVAGEYWVSASITASGTDTDYLTAYVYQNGTAVIKDAKMFGGGLENLTPRAVGLVRANVSDTIGGYYDAQAAWTVEADATATALHIVKVSN